MIFIGLLTYGNSLISMYFMGKLGKNELAGGCLSIGIANITGYSIISGLSTGMEAISSQAYGANMWVLMGQILQRTIVILLTACLPISLLWLYSEPILVFCGQEPVISSIAYSYLLFSLPDIVFQSIINPLRIFLRTQNITLPLMLSAIIALTLHAPINYVLVCQLSLNDIRGIAMAGAITDFIILAFLVLYLHHTSVCNNTFQGLLFNAIEAVATMGIVIQATSLVYIFISSFSQAVSTRVGNELGTNCPHNAKISTWIALACAVFMSIVATFFMTAMRNTWGFIFTDDATILSLTAMSMPVVGLCEIGKWLQTTGCGVLRASTRPTLGANINFGSFSVLGCQ
ncbi:hypothetical protein LWI28_003663 [Acer negundo]|uniref:Uncharacterized protein n=1 Tax=Acer negundo TaxID=4023 RepID=A0AAD5NL70_ACENE|nr:hypothetical protein LWI28_003663 [Acer negundo]